MWLEKITEPAILKQLSSKDRAQLCAQIRERIIAVVAQNEGHLGASLGTD